MLDRPKILDLGEWKKMGILDAYAIAACGLLWIYPTLTRGAICIGVGMAFATPPSEPHGRY